MRRWIVSHPILVWLAVVLVALIGVAVWALRDAGSSTPVSEGDALDRFHEAAGDGDGAPARRGVPRAGVYTYRQSGSESGGLGPASLSRGLPGEARYLVTPVPGGYQEELDISQEHVEAVRYRVDAAGSHALSRRTKVTFLGFGRDQRDTLRPAPLQMPARPAVGRGWTSRYRAGELPVSARSRVLRAEPVEVGGRSLPALVVETVAETGGAHPGTRVDTLWWSPELALALRWRIDMRIRGTAKLTTRAELTLESVEPAT